MKAFLKALWVGVLWVIGGLALLVIIALADNTAASTPSCTTGKVAKDLQRVCDTQQGVVCYYVESSSGSVMSKAFYGPAVSCVKLDEAK